MAMSCNNGLSPAIALAALPRKGTSRRLRPIRPRTPATDPPPVTNHEHDPPQHSEATHEVVHNKGESENRYCCHKCSNTYSNRANLNVHLNVHSNSKCFQCDKCFKFFSRRSSLYNHKKTHFLTDNVYKCNICETIFDSHEALQDHESSHLDKNGIMNYEAQCFVCAAILSTKFGLKLHIMQRHPEIVHGKTEKTHSCVECGKKYSNETLLKAHMKTHSAVKIHTCSTCDYSATTRVGLQRHVERIHLKTRKFECSLCGKLFVSQPDRKLHMLRHYKIKPVQCDLCPMRFYSTRELRKHKFAHSGQKPHRCDDCDVAFAYVESLRRHVSAHLPDPISCEMCPRQFRCRKSLAKHMRSHPPASNVFKCSDCGKSYKNYKCLDTHKTKLKHNETVYCCHECGLEFQGINQFNSHERNGHKYTIFICQLCKVSFQNKNKLGDHLRVGHGIKEESDTLEQSSNEISMPVKQTSSPFRYTKQENDFFEQLGSMEVRIKSEENATDALFDECNPNEGVEITTTTAVDKLIDNYCPIEGVEVTTASDAMDVFSCTHCDKLFPSELDRTEHALHRHSVVALDRSTSAAATSIQLVAGGASENFTSSLADLVEINLSSVPLFL